MRCPIFICLSGFPLQPSRNTGSASHLAKPTAKTPVSDFGWVCEYDRSPPQRRKIDQSNSVQIWLLYSGVTLRSQVNGYNGILKGTRWTAKVLLWDKLDHRRSPFKWDAYCLKSLSVHFSLHREFPDALCQFKPQQQKYNLSVLCTCARGRREKDIFKTAEAEQWLYTVHRLCSTDATIMSLLSKKPE